ncbi:MAG: branched-chain amino acid aminotransferase [Eubacteriales bacterium]
MMDIKVEKTALKKEIPNTKDLVFGTNFIDHMFLLDYTEGKGWHDPRIVPYGPISISPAAKCLHYGQEVFEGMKAYRRPDGEIQLFRPECNMERLNLSCNRICMPEVPVDLALEGVRRLVDIDRDWVPHEKDTSLYIRPFVIANDGALGLHTSKNYLYAVVACPVGAYYSEGLNPVKIFVEEQDVRAVKGGTGMAKTGGNYAAAIRASERAEKKGFSQVLWLDGVERKYVDEVGAMNVMFKVGDRILTPDLNGAVLDGITRRSCIALLKDWGYTVEERRIDIDELFEAAKTGVLEEAWGCGTAAVISPIGSLTREETTAEICGGKIGELTQKVYDNITGIQWGTMEDTHGWTMKV